MAERPAETAIVAAEETRERSSSRLAGCPWSAVLFGFQNRRAHHRRRGKRYHQGDRDGRGKRHREFAKQSADHSAHHQDGNENRDQRGAHGQDGEGDLPCAQQRGLKGRFSLLDVAGDVFEHDDGVVDDEPRRDGERHEREIVQAVAEQVHHSEGADEGNRNGDARNEGGSNVAQEGEHYQDDEHAGDDERAFDIFQRAPDGWCSVHNHRHVDGLRNGCFQSGEQLVDPVDRLDDVCARLPKHDQHDGLFAVHESQRSDIFHRIRHIPQVGEPNRRSGAVTDNERCIFLRLVELIVRFELPGPLPQGELSLGAVHVGGAQ